jgi:hypothetical protein
MEDLTNNNAFDRYVARFGWTYDNGGQYCQQHWDWYTGWTPGVVLMRQAPDRVCVVRFEKLTPTELWLGTIHTTDEFDKMVSSLDVLKE